MSRQIRRPSGPTVNTERGTMPTLTARRARRTIAWLVTAGLATASACGGTDSARVTGTSGARPADCPPIGQLEVTPRRSEAVLVDISDSASDPARQRERAAAALRVLAGFTDGSTVVHVGTFDASSTTVRFDRCLDGTVLVAVGNNDRVRELGTPALLDAVSARLEALVGAQPLAPGSDPAAALAAGLRATLADDVDEHAVTLITDGAASSGCLAVPAGQDPADLDTARQAGQACATTMGFAQTADTSVRFLGVGRTSGTGTSTAEATWLTTALEAMCRQVTPNCTATPDLPA